MMPIIGKPAPLFTAAVSYTHLDVYKRQLDNWSRYVPALRGPMQEALQRVRGHEGLSRNVQEIVSKALEFAA